MEGVEAAVVDTVGAEVTAAMEGATATVEVVMEVEPADTVAAAEEVVTVEGLLHVVHLHHTTAEVVVVADAPEGTIVHAQDHTLLVSILTKYVRVI